MWLTSKIPARSRTAVCSCRIPSYWTGISQPANGTSRAPAATCRACSGVRLSVSVPAAISANGTLATELRSTLGVSLIAMRGASVVRTGTAMAVACVVAAAAARCRLGGTYDVLACAAPGAGGVNHSLTSYIGSYDPARQAEANRSYELDGSCAGGLIARSHPLHTTAPWLTDGGWRFDAPAGTEITRVVSWRFGEARDFGDDPATPFVDEGDHWRVALTDGTGQFVGGPAGGETCAHGGGIPACTIGEPNGGRSQHDVRTNALRWAVSCGGEIIGGCPTSYADPITAPGYPLATIALYGTAITLTDPSAPALSLGGPLFGGGWRKPSDGATYSASDNSGIRTAELTVGPAGARDDRACDFTYKVPCANATDRPLALAAAPPDGSVHGPADRDRRLRQPGERREAGDDRRHGAVGEPQAAEARQHHRRRHRLVLRPGRGADPGPQRVRRSRTGLW